MRSITKKSPAIIAILATAALTATACSSSKSSKPSGAANSSTSAGGKSIPVSTTNDINAKDVSTLKGGTFTLAVDQYSSQWNVSTNNGNEADTAKIMSTMMPRLFTFDGAGTPKPNKDYLVSADLSTTTGNRS